MKVNAKRCWWNGEKNGGNICFSDKIKEKSSKYHFFYNFFNPNISEKIYDENFVLLLKKKSIITYIITEISIILLRFL